MMSEMPVAFITGVSMDPGLFIPLKVGVIRAQHQDGISDLWRNVRSIAIETTDFLIASGWYQQRGSVVLSVCLA